jgi:tRNA(Ile)-lysidine synthase
MVLWHLLWVNGYDVLIAHVNYQLRGEDSNADEKLVSETAKARNQNIYIKNIDTKKEIECSGLGTQEFARKIRYDFFEALCTEHKADFVITAHHANDNLETLLMRLGRGTGLKGLLGIPQRNKNILRPLLQYTSEEISEYAKQNKIEWREDISNVSNDYLRNELRNAVIPTWQKAQPDILKNMQANITRWQSISAIYQLQLSKLKTKCFFEQAKGEYRISISGLKKTGHAELLLFEILSDFDATPKQAQEAYKIIEANHGATLALPKHNVIKVQQDLMITKTFDSSVVIIEKQSENVFFELGKITQDQKASIICTSSDDAYLNFTNLVYPLTLRTTKPGDYFYPLGLGKKKKISKFLIDKKIPLHKKKNVWVLCSGPHIVWVVGHRIDERFKAIEGQPIVKFSLVPNA